MLKKLLIAMTLVTSASTWADTKLSMQTSLGEIEIELFDDQAPITTSNFKQYVKEGFYTGTIFHRVIPDFMVQGGGLNTNLQEKSNTRATIKNEASNGLKNEYGTIAMARTTDPHSARSQFFINVNDNPSLNATEDSAGYAVFGRVSKGMDIVEKMLDIPTTRVGQYGDVPTQTILIESVKFENK